MTNQPQIPPAPIPAGTANVGIMQTAKFGMYGLIATAIGILISIIGLPFGGLFNLAGLVLAIMSLVKKETPKWPAWVTISLSIIGIIVTLFLIFAALALLGGLAVMAS